MDTHWKENEIIDILKQLEAQSLPFSGYSCFGKEQCLKIGEGGTGYIYNLYKRSNQQNDCVVKIIGFIEPLDISEIKCEFSLQQTLAKHSRHIVQVYEVVFLKVWLDDNGHIEKNELLQENSEMEEIEDNCIALAFVRMEKLTPVIQKDSQNQVCCTNNELIDNSYDEITKLFYDISCALECAHKRKILHGDIKPENIFYDPNHKIYKLGDFGSAVQTEYGVAKVAGYTNGYVAPEVYNCTVKRYDASADIYSLGMAIFVFRNGLKKAGSNGYRANLEYQYQEDYVLDRPENDYNDDDRLYNLIKKMCSFRPEKRPQKMGKIISKLSEIMVRPWFGWQVRFAWVYVVIGVMEMVAGSMNSWRFVWIGENTMIGIVALLKAGTLFLRNRKPMKYYYIAKKVDVVYLISYFLIEAWNILGPCWFLSDRFIGNDYFFVDAPALLLHIMIIEFFVFLGVDKSNFWGKHRKTKL